MSTATAPQTTRRNTVSIVELRRVLANDAAAATHFQSPPRNIPSASHVFPGHSHSPSSSTSSSPSHSPLSTPAGLSGGAHPHHQFDVRAASESCKAMSGYVSFMDIAGLGAPAGAAYDEDEADREAQQARDRGWTQWFGIPPALGSRPATKARSRSSLPANAKAA